MCLICERCDYLVPKNYLGEYICRNCGTIYPYAFSEGEAMKAPDLRSINDPDFVIKNGNLQEYKGDKQHVTIPDGTNSISDWTFNLNQRVRRVAIPHGVIYVGNNAFSNCNLVDVTLPNSVAFIGAKAFYGCEATKNLTIPDSVTHIGFHAFYGNRFSSLKIGRGVRYLGWAAFSFCNFDTVTSNNPIYRAEGDCLIEGTRVIAGSNNSVIPSGVTAIDDYAFSGRKNLKTIRIPDGVTHIGNSAFYGCENLTGVFIPDSVTHIGESAFSNCVSLTEIVIPDSVTHIGDCAFYDCHNLKRIVLGSSLEQIGDVALKNCNLSSIICNGKKYHAEGGCLIENGTKVILGTSNCVIPKGVTHIGQYAFSKIEGLTHMDIPDGVTTIEKRAFDGCSSLSEISIPDSVTCIEEYAFSETAFEADRRNWCGGALYIGNHLISVKKTEKATFKVKDGTITIADCAFSYASNITEILIPDSVVYIGSYALRECSKCSSIKIPSSVTHVGESALPNKLENGIWEDDVFYVDGHAIKANNEIQGICYIKDGTRTIADKAFSGLCYLASIVIPEGVTTIGREAFLNCDDLIYVQIPKTITHISPDAFAGCDKHINIYVDDVSIIRRLPKDWHPVDCTFRIISDDNRELFQLAYMP